MEQSIENKTELKTKLLNFYNSNKVKIYFLIFIIILILISFTFIKYKNEKNNTIVAEKYIEAGLNLTSNQKDKAKKIYEEIIYSKNNFYSILALNTILEKNLISDNDKILEYFEILEKSSSLKSQKDLITLKKALYLIKENDTQNGNNLLKELIENKSSLEPIAQEILDK
tara:strand:- start:303 stop:812 length:510 start_codon:yes stop_codon:yes gene_type:complete